MRQMVRLHYLHIRQT
jgi:hypothetical protein